MCLILTFGHFCSTLPYHSVFLRLHHFNLSPLYSHIFHSFFPVFVSSLSIVLTCRLRNICSKRSKQRTSTWVSVDFGSVYTMRRLKQMSPTFFSLCAIIQIHVRKSKVVKIWRKSAKEIKRKYDIWLSFGHHFLSLFHFHFRVGKYCPVHALLKSPEMQMTNLNK